MTPPHVQPCYEILLQEPIGCKPGQLAHAAFYDSTLIWIFALPAELLLVLVDALVLAPADRASGIICDQCIMLNGYDAAKNYPEHLRRIRFHDQETGTLVFLANNTTLPALTIAVLYKSRWQIERFIKWIKQHLRIKRFLATSENAVRSPIWCAVATYVLIVIVKKKLELDASLYTCLQVLSVSIFEKIEIPCALQPYLHKPTNIQPLTN